MLKGLLFLLALLVIGCASGGLNPAQERAWDAFKACRAAVAPTANLVEVRENGTLSYTTRDGHEVNKMRDCLIEKSGFFSLDLEPFRPEAPYPKK